MLDQNSISYVWGCRMRKTFAEVLRTGGVDIKTEYYSLHALVFESDGLYEKMKLDFRGVWFAGTAVSLDDFNLRHGFSFTVPPTDPSLDDLLSFCEYCYNFACALPSPSYYGTDCCMEVIDHIEVLADQLDYVLVDDDDLRILVARNANVQAAAEVAPAEIAFDLVKYDYRGYDGDLEGKRAILLRLIGYLEPKRKQLEALAKDVTNDLFFIANNLNLRHNNTDPHNAGKYKQVVADMDVTELEGWYDLCRDLCAAAILLLGYEDKREELAEVKKRL